jgi:hypothetical protein
MVSKRHLKIRVFFNSSKKLLKGTPKVHADHSNIEYIEVYSELVAVTDEDVHIFLYRVNSSETLFK